MRVDNRETPSREFVTRAPAHVIPQRSGWFFAATTRADDNAVASVLAVPVAPSLAPTRGAGLGQTTAYSEPAPSLPGGVSATTPGKAPQGTTSISSAPPVGTDPAGRATDLVPQTPSVLSYSASRVAGANRKLGEKLKD